MTYVCYLTYGEHVAGSVYSVLAVALERYFTICKPFQFNLVSYGYRVNDYNTVQR